MANRNHASEPPSGLGVRTTIGMVASSIVVTGLAAGLISMLPGNSNEKLALGFGFALLVLVFLYGTVILTKMITGDIDITTILGESGGGASMARFQLLIFTLIIGLSFFFVTANSKEGRLPDIPSNVLALLGISATTYGVGKGIQAAGGLEPKRPRLDSPERKRTPDEEGAPREPGEPE